MIKDPRSSLKTIFTTKKDPDAETRDLSYTKGI